MIMTDVAIYFSVNETRLTVAVTANGERESYDAYNISVDFKLNRIKFNTKMFYHRITFDNIAIAHNVKKHITIKNDDEK